MAAWGHCPLRSPHTCHERHVLTGFRLTCVRRGSRGGTARCAAPTPAPAAFYGYPVVVRLVVILLSWLRSWYILHRLLRVVRSSFAASHSHATFYCVRCLRHFCSVCFVDVFRFIVRLKPDGNFCNITADYLTASSHSPQGEDNRHYVAINSFPSGFNLTIKR